MPRRELIVWIASEHLNRKSTPAQDAQPAQELPPGQRLDPDQALIRMMAT